MKVLALPVFILIVFQACAPRPVYRMEPQAENTTFNQGTAYVHLQQGDIELTMSYYRHLGDRFVMDVEIVNTSDSVIRIDPLQFSYEAYKNMSANHPQPSDPVLASRKAVDPEKELLRKDMAISRSIANQKTSTIFYAIGQAAYIGASVTADTEEEREEIEEDSEKSYYRHRAQQRDRELTREGLRDQRRVWELETLRKTDLFPDEYIRGYVFFKNEPDARAYMIRYAVNKLIFEIFYRQQKYVVE